MKESDGQAPVMCSDTLGEEMESKLGSEREPKFWKGRNVGGAAKLIGERADARVSVCVSVCACARMCVCVYD